MDYTDILKGIFMFTLFVILGSLFMIAGFVLNENEMKFRTEKELFKANLISKFERISLVIGIVCLVVALFYI